MNAAAGQGGASADDGDEMEDEGGLCRGEDDPAEEGSSPRNAELLCDGTQPDIAGLGNDPDESRTKPTFAGSRSGKSMQLLKQMLESPRSLKGRPKSQGAWQARKGNGKWML